MSNRPSWLCCMHRRRRAGRWSWPRGQRIILNVGRADDCRDVMCVLAEESSAWMPNDPTGNKIVPVHRLISLRRARRVGVLPQAERSETLESPDP